MQLPQPRVGFVFFMATGLMLFALFFGAGNLIFPALMGQQAGDMNVPAVLGFVLTGAGLPLVGVVAMAYSGERDVQALAGRVSPLFGLGFALLLYLSIGPLFGMPRTATVAFEVGLLPLLPKEQQQVALAVFSLLFFGLAFWLAMSPSKLIDRIGKILTPVLLLCIGLLVASAWWQPMGSWQPAQGDFAQRPLAAGFLAGYQTMDALASLVFAMMVIEVLRSAGVRQSVSVARLTMGAGLLAGVFLTLVYVSVAFMGASSVALLGVLDNGAQVLARIAQYYWGTGGNVLLALIIFLACLSTAVGLIAACADYFQRLYPRWSYRSYALALALISCALANKGLSGIIAFSVPMLMLLYPVTVVLIVLTFLHRWLGGRQSMYVCAMLPALAVGMLDAWHTAFGFSPVSQQLLTQWLPWYGIGLGWLLPALLGLIVGQIYRWWVKPAQASA